MITQDNISNILQSISSGLLPHASGVRVAWSADGVSAYTNGKTVYLPRPKDAVVSGQSWRVLMGYVDHEVAHVLWTEFKPNMTRNKAHHQILNIVEDARINRLAISRWPGSATNLGALYRQACRTLSSDRASIAVNATDPIVNKLNALHFRMEDMAPEGWSFDPASVEFAGRWRKVLLQAFAAGADTDRMIQIAWDIHCELMPQQDTPKPPTQPEEPEAGEGGQGPQTDEQQTDEDETGRGPASDDSEDSEDSEDSDEGSSKSEEDSDEGSSKSEEDSDEGHGPASDDSEKSKSRDGEVEDSDQTPGTEMSVGGGGKPREEIVGLASGIEAEALGEALGTEVKSGDEAKRGGASGVLLLERSFDGKVTGAEGLSNRKDIEDHVGQINYREREVSPGLVSALDTIRARSVGLSQRLERVLKTRTLSRRIGELEDGDRLDLTALPMLGAGISGGRVWEETIQGQDVDTVVGIYLDASGSTDAPMSLEKRGSRKVTRATAQGFAAGMLAESLDKAGAKSEVLAWSCGPGSILEDDSGKRDGWVSTVVFSELKPVEQKVTPEVRRRLIGAPNWGGTPFEDAVKFAVARTARRPEKRKVAIILTDGEVSDSGEFAEQVVVARKVGVELVLVGVGTGLQKVKVEEKAFSYDVAGLPDCLAKFLPRLIERAGKGVRR
jgi:nitric oxide reductase activation protein